MKYLIASANGYGNAGDDICAIVTEKMIRKVDPKAKIVVTNPPFDAELAEKADALVLGGGGIVYDANKENMENYLAYVDYGIEHKKLTIGLGLGQQGIVTKAGEKRYKEAFNKMSLLTVRSTLDAQRLASFGVETAKGTQDLGFSYDYSMYARMYEFKQSIRGLKVFKNRKKKLGVVLSNQEHLVNDLKLAFSPKEKENAKEFKKQFGENIERLMETYDLTIITQSRDDLEMAEEYREKYGCEVFSYHTKKDLSKLLRVYANQDLVLTQRFHGIVFSFMIGVPVIVLGYHSQKQFNLLYDLNMNDRLLMYHKPLEIKKMMKSLILDRTNIDDYMIQATETKRLIVDDMALSNEQRLDHLINGDQSDDYYFAQSPWTLRYEVIANMFPKGKVVMDLGAGEQYIRKWIQPSSYYPIDIYKRTDETIVVNIDDDPLPKIDDTVEVILAQGVFEYLKNSERVMEDLHSYADTMVTTCFYRKEPYSLWNRSFTKESFEKALTDSGWTIEKSEKVPRMPQYVYLCKAAKK